MAAIQQAIERVIEPHTGRALRELGTEVKVATSGDRTTVGVVLGFPLARGREALEQAVTEAVRALGGTEAVSVELQWRVAAAGVQHRQQRVQDIKNIVVVASGKGGVGKSTTAANLALALAYDGAAVGLLDADIYGPSQARMMGLSGQRPTSQDGKSFAPLVAHGVKVISIGLLVDEEQPMVWRGPMVSQALTQLLNDCRWGTLDYLVVDMPPGTGDIQLTLSQRVPISGAVIVTTPQDIALLDARRGLRMFDKVGVPVLGIVENMSTHICSQCGHEEHVFGAGGGRRMAEQYAVDLLAELPLDIRIREQADGGCPTVAAEPESKLGQAYIRMARRTAGHLAALALRADKAAPSITVEDT